MSTEGRCISDVMHVHGWSGIIGLNSLNQSARSHEYESRSTPSPEDSTTICICEGYLVFFVSNFGCKNNPKPFYPSCKKLSRYASLEPFMISIFRSQFHISFTV